MSNVALPPEKVIVREGRVVQFERWVMWNGEPWKVVEIKRHDRASYTCSVGDPEHGGSTKTGSIDEVVAMFHPDFAAWYRRLFQFEVATEADIREISLMKRMEVVFQE